MHSPKTETFGDILVRKLVLRAMLTALFLAVLVVAGSAIDASAAVPLDRSFGTNGLVLIPGRDRSHPGREAVAIDPGGGLILVADQTLQRLDSAGRPDRGFGKNGAVRLPKLAGGALEITGAAVDRERRIVVVGTSLPPQPPRELVSLPDDAATQFLGPTYTAARILRYLPNGRLDGTFGDGGIVETTFGLPTPEVEGVKLAPQPVVETTGVAVDGSGRVVVTGGAAEGAIVSYCFHDDFESHTANAAFVSRLTESGQLDYGFGGGDGVFGGRSTAENPLGMEEAGRPVMTPNDGVIFQRGGFGKCSPGGLGFVRLTPAGTILYASEPSARWRVFDAATTLDGSVVLLLGSPKGSGAPERIVKLRPGGSVDRTFGHGGKVVLRLPEASHASRVAVGRTGEVLVQAVEAPRYRPSETGEEWRSQFSMMLIGLRANGSRDTRIGPHGIVTTHIPDFNGEGGFWLDRKGRPTVTASYLPESGVPGFAAVRFAFGG